MKRRPNNSNRLSAKERAKQHDASRMLFSSNEQWMAYVDTKARLMAGGMDRDDAHRIALGELPK